MSRLNPFTVTATKNEKEDFQVLPAVGRPDANWKMNIGYGFLYFLTKKGVKSYFKRKGYTNIKGV